VTQDNTQASTPAVQNNAPAQVTNNDTTDQTQAVAQPAVYTALASTSASTIRGTGVDIQA
jgi:hypothetical protein